MTTPAIPTAMTDMSLALPETGGRLKIAKLENEINNVLKMTKSISGMIFMGTPYCLIIMWLVINIAQKAIENKMFVNGIFFKVWVFWKMLPEIKTDLNL